MKDFMLLFRQPSFDYSKSTQEEMQILEKKWKEWVSCIATEGKFTSHGSRLGIEGNVLKADGAVVAGPFKEVREILGSFILVKAKDLEDATNLAQGCPSLEEGGSVEIRPVI